jgi:hypothetical protein
VNAASEEEDKNAGRHPTFNRAFDVLGELSSKHAEATVRFVYFVYNAREQNYLSACRHKQWPQLGSMYFSISVDFECYVCCSSGLALHIFPLKLLTTYSNRSLRPCLRFANFFLIAPICKILVINLRLQSTRSS